MCLSTDVWLLLNLIITFISSLEDNPFYCAVHTVNSLIALVKN